MSCGVIAVADREPSGIQAQVRSSCAIATSSLPLHGPQRDDFNPRQPFRLVATLLDARAAGFIVVAQTFFDEPVERLRVDASSPGGWPWLRDYLEEFIVPLGKPTLLNVPMSHSRGALPIPHGARVHLDATRHEVTILDDIVD